MSSTNIQTGLFLTRKRRNPFILYFSTILFLLLFFCSFRFSLFFYFFFVYLFFSSELFCLSESSQRRIGVLRVIIIHIYKSL